MTRRIAMCSLLAAALVTSAATGAGAQSADAWQVTVVPYMMGASMSGTTAVGGQQLDIDYETGDDATLFKYDVLTQGPVAGFAFRFQRRAGAWDTCDGGLFARRNHEMSRSVYWM